MQRFSVIAISLSLVGVGLAACSSDDSILDGGSDGAADVASDQTLDAPLDHKNPVDAGNDTAPDVASDATDGGVDADAADGDDGDALASEGTPCTPPNDIQTEDCGLCGTQFRACLADGDGGDAWGAWGFCQNEVKNGCDPKGTYADIACGNCGTEPQVCLSNCTFNLTQTCTEPPNACKPGTTNFQLGLSCDGGGRERTCDTSCQYGNWGLCQTGPSLPKIIVPSTVGTISSLVQTFNSTDKLARLNPGTCPTTLSTSITSYNYIVVQNQTTQQATIDIYHSSATNIDTVITVYSGTVPPDDNTVSQRDACSGYVDDDCFDHTNTSPPSCVSSSAGLMKLDGHQVVLAAGASAVVYSTTWFTNVTGDFQINVKTDSLL